MVDAAAPRPASRTRIWAGGLSLSGMLGLIAAMASARGDRVTVGHVDPLVWWHVGRASGLVAWVLLGASVLGGVSLSTSLSGARTRSWTTQLHTFVGVLAVVFTGIHLAAVLASDDLGVGWVQLLVPFTRTAAPTAQATGVIAAYLLVAVTVTTAVRGFLPWRWWRRLHLLSFPLFVSACAHTALAGSDADDPLLLWPSAGLGAALLGLVGYRLLLVRRRRFPAGPTPIRAPSPALPARPDPDPSDTSAAPDQPPEIRVIVAQVAWEADGVVSLVLTSPDRAPLPAWAPGAHLALELPSGRERYYSLFGDPADRHRYRIAVQRQDQGRGGSREIHLALPVGTALAVRPPRNTVHLGPADDHLFVAGGIGITGVLSLVETVAARGDRWRMLYGGRTRTAMAFVDRVLALDPDRVDVVPQDERGLLPLATALAELPAGGAVYCCGPPPLIDAVAALVGARGDVTLHVERFAGAAATGGAPVLVDLRRTGRTVEVGPEQSILSAVRTVLPAAPGSCEQGVCGSCRVSVLAGEPEHRDQLLRPAERAAGQMLICVSRARGDRLILDL